jgi:hypothetical protein
MARQMSSNGGGKAAGALAWAGAMEEVTVRYIRENLLTGDRSAASTSGPFTVARRSAPPCEATPSLNHQHVILPSAHTDASASERNRSAIQVILGPGQFLPFQDEIPSVVFGFDTVFNSSVGLGT